MARKLTTFDFRLVANKEDKFIVAFIGVLVHTTLSYCRDWRSIRSMITGGEGQGTVLIYRRDTGKNNTYS